MREAVETRSYAAALSVLVVAEWLYFDWASRAPNPLPGNFVHAEWITLHDNPDFCGFVDFLRAELDRVGPAQADVPRLLPSGCRPRTLLLRSCLARARIATRLAGPRVGAFWKPSNPALISPPGPAWLGAR
jgi:hypothetical protein